MTPPLNLNMENSSDVKMNSLYVYTFINEVVKRNISILFDKSYLKQYIFLESNPERMNNFESLLWTQTITESMVKQMIIYYFNNEENNNNNNTINDIRNSFIMDFNQLRERYLNYQCYLFYENNLNNNNNNKSSMIYRKLLLNFIYFMEMEESCLMETRKCILIITILWCHIGIYENILTQIFIPLAFARWYKGCNFVYIKSFLNILYNIFYETIRNNKSHCLNEVANSVDMEIKRIIASKSLLQFYHY